jgi:N-acetylglucosaminyl-diphospho-decaprenol L-rhamnosyltransferase
LDGYLARVVLCENGTGGNAAELLRNTIASNGWNSRIDLTVIYPNRGFTRGNNAVIRRALESDDPLEYILLLNADTLVNEHALDMLIEFMDAHPKVGIAGNMLLRLDGSSEASPFRFPGIAAELDRGLRLGFVSKLLTPWRVAIPTPREARRVDWVSGASMILRRTMLKQIGLLDEGLYTYYGDVDICLRAWRVGWETWYVPESRVIHLAGASTGVTSHSKRLARRPSYWYQTHHRYFLKNYGALYTALVQTAFIIEYAAWRMRRRIQGKPDTDTPYTLSDSIRYSVFRAGPNLRMVENPPPREISLQR